MRTASTDRVSFDNALGHCERRSFAAATSQRFSRIAITPRRNSRTRSTPRHPGIAAGATAGAPLGVVLGWLGGAPARSWCPASTAAGGWAQSWRQLAGAGAAGATGGLVGGLIGAGIPEVEAKRYAGRIREGAYLLSVHCDDKTWAKRAEEILQATGANTVAKTSEARADYRP